MAQDIAPLMTCQEVADYLGLHIHTVKRIPRDELPFYRLSTRGDRRYRRADVIAFLEQRTAATRWWEAG